MAGGPPCHACKFIYICLYICGWGPTPACMYIRVHMWPGAAPQVYAYIYAYMYVYVGIYMCIYIYIWPGATPQVYMFIWPGAQTPGRMHMYGRRLTPVHICVYIYMCTCLYIYMHDLPVKYMFCGRVPRFSLRVYK